MEDELEETTIGSVFSKISSLFIRTVVEEEDIQKALSSGKQLNGDQCFNLYKQFLTVKRGNKKAIGSVKIEKYAEIGYIRRPRSTSSFLHIVALQLANHLPHYAILFEDGTSQSWKVLSSSKEMRVLYLRGYETTPGDVLFIDTIKKNKPRGRSPGCV